jgi:hypothetical protein
MGETGLIGPVPIPSNCSVPGDVRLANGMGVEVVIPGTVTFRRARLKDGNP